MYSQSASKPALLRILIKARKYGMGFRKLFTLRFYSAGDVVIRHGVRSVPAMSGKDIYSSDGFLTTRALDSFNGAQSQ